jgi:hypothetical protein
MCVLQKVFTGLRFFILLIFLLIVSKVEANPYVMGADIFYQCVGANQYEVTLMVYQDCQEPAPPATQIINWTGSCGSGSISVNLVSTTDLTPVCVSEQTTCQGGGGTFGVNQHIFTGIVNIPPNSTLSL